MPIYIIGLCLDGVSMLLCKWMVRSWCSSPRDISLRQTRRNTIVTAPTERHRQPKFRAAHIELV